MPEPQTPGQPPILSHKDYAAPSLFLPENLLREARRQKGLPKGEVPETCILDPDGDMVRSLAARGLAHRSRTWACYHTDLHVFTRSAAEYGVVGRAVGASFAVLVAEELFASGCRLLISMTSAGQVRTTRKPPYFILIAKALRDEGTSYHYLPPSAYAGMDGGLLARLEGAFSHLQVPVDRGATWTTDAPFRETAEAIERCRAEGILAVEMEAAALYAFARARSQPVICFAHVTNQMARVEGDFEKGEADGTEDALEVISAAARRWKSGTPQGNPS